MKSMEQLNIDKECFFALYWKQTVQMGWDLPYKDKIYPVDNINLKNLADREYLELRSIHQLTDEEKQVIADLWNEELNSDSFRISVVDSWLNSKNPHSNVFVFDYLRSIGILIPFRNYSVEQIIEMGWAKIKE